MRRMNRWSLSMVCLAMAATGVGLADSDRTEANNQVTRSRHDLRSLRLWKPRLLPGCDKFTFTMYGCPGQLEPLKELVRAMQEGGLGNGSRLLLHPRHAAALGDDCDRLKGTGDVAVLAEWTNPATGRPAAISNERLAELNEEYLPIAVTGDPVQYEINRTSQGWAVELVNHHGVVKKPDQPAVADPHGLARVQLRPRVPIRSARQWSRGDDTVLNPAPVVPVAVGPSETVFVEMVAD